MIEVRHLSKKYGQLNALQDISFKLPDKGVVLIVGPNGAGKSTFFRVLLGYVQSGSGDILFNGMPMTDSQYFLSQIGYVPENCPLYSEMNVCEFIKFSADMHKMTPADFDKNIIPILDRLQLKEVLTQKIETLSKGFQRRVGIAGALIHNPDILILDEPTEGLDPNQKHQMHNLLREYSRDHLIIISSHLMEEVENIADRVLLFKNGRLVWDGTPQELSAQAGDNRIETAFRLLTGEK